MGTKASPRIAAGPGSRIDPGLSSSGIRTVFRRGSFSLLLDGVPEAVRPDHESLPLQGIFRQFADPAHGVLQECLELLDVLGIPEPKGMDGRSFLPVLKTGKQAGLDYIIKEYNENSGGNRSPMRAIQGRKYSYIFNPWSDGERVFRTATTGTIAYKEMQRLAAIDPEAAERLRLFDFRDPEELYDYENEG